jgi:ER-bound oxygenase mpaB/B'/Rubber oxygenase, catalytic domain
MNRDAIAQTIAALDPEADHQRIVHLLAGYEFPWDMTRSLELALLRTFCVPSIAQLLDRTGELQHHGQKRYDDTGLIIAEILKWGYDDPRGAGFLARMNAIHGHYAISNADFLYVLSTFIYEPIRWCDRFGWRPFSDREKQAFYYFWRSVGERMAIQAIPPSYELLEQYNRDYEMHHFRYAISNQRVADATLRMFLNWFPAFLRPVLQPGAAALLDEPMRQALGWPIAPIAMQRAIAQILRWRSRILRQLPPRQQPDFFVDQHQRSYPHGYQLEDIGPPGMVAQLNQQDGINRRSDV